MNEFKKEYERLEGLNIRDPTPMMLERYIYPSECFIKDLVLHHKAQLNANEWGYLYMIENLLSNIITSLESRLDSKIVKMMQDRKQELHELLINPYGRMED